MKKQFTSAKAILDTTIANETILASEKDREVFFNTLMNPLGPNQKLRDAAERYKLFIQESR